jgi:hypothetical protein
MRRRAPIVAGIAVVWLGSLAAAWWFGHQQADAEWGEYFADLADRSMRSPTECVLVATPEQGEELARTVQQHADAGYRLTHTALGPAYLELGARILTFCR